MERFLAWLDRRLGRRVPAGLPVWLVGLWAVSYVLIYVKPEVIGDFTLLREGLVRGEVWRLITFLFLPPMLGRSTLDLILAFFVLQFSWTVLSSLEAEWGAVRFWTYYLIGALGTIAGALLTGYADNTYLYLSLLLAFGTVFPDYEILLFLILPVKMKWLAIFDGAFLVYSFIVGSYSARAAIAMALLNYSLFFASHLLDLARGRARDFSRGSRSSRLDAFRGGSRVERRARVCARCGKSEADDPKLEFRVCDCEKCGGKPTDFCLEHAKAH
jgi:hypothetical protein